MPMYVGEGSPALTYLLLQPGWLVNELFALVPAGSSL